MTSKIQHVEYFIPSLISNPDTIISVVTYEGERRRETDRNTTTFQLDMNPHRALNWSIMEKICFEVTFQLIK